MHVKKNLAFLGKNKSKEERTTKGEDGEEKKERKKEKRKNIYNFMIHLPARLLYNIYTLFCNIQ
jgi:hypothetical protein